MRRSSLYAFDVDDFDDGSKSLLRLCHRPDTGTPLKNKRRGERDARLNRETANVIADFLKHNHPMGPTSTDGRHYFLTDRLDSVEVRSVYTTF